MTGMRSVSCMQGLSLPHDAYPTLVRARSLLLVIPAKAGMTKLFVRLIRAIGIAKLRYPFAIHVSIARIVPPDS
jgi:hypothetical protein